MTGLRRDPEYYARIKYHDQILSFDPANTLDDTKTHPHLRPAMPGSALDTRASTASRFRTSYTFDNSVDKVEAFHIAAQEKPAFYRSWHVRKPPIIDSVLRQPLMDSVIKVPQPGAQDGGRDGERDSRYRER